jgi:hypothetical protein
MPSPDDPTAARRDRAPTAERRSRIGPTAGSTSQLGEVAMSETGRRLIGSLCALVAVSMLPACSVDLSAVILVLTVVAGWMLRADRRHRSPRLEMKYPRERRLF